MLATLTAVFNLLLVLTGFGLVIVIHELGHFLAARWAGVRVLAFAVGFGPALFSWRKGMGFRRGSSEPEYRKLLAAEAAGVTTNEGARTTYHGISPTEYRFNVIPFGGYVKMLGQDDANPAATSDAPDSYTSAPVAKRMVIISAGVVMNIILAALLFIIVFLVGLRTEPPRVGDVLPDSPAAQAVASNAAELGVTEPGLLPGDTILSIDGDKPDSFNDLVLAAAMAAPGRALEVVVERPGVPQPLRFHITPREDRLSRMLQFGIGPAAGGRLPEADDEETRKAFRRAAETVGLGPDVQPGMRLVSVNGEPAHTADAIALAARRSGGRPIHLAFEDDGGRSVSVALEPSPEFQTVEFLKDANLIATVPHLLGIPAPMRVLDTAEPGAQAGLRPGDIFARIGEVDWPTVTAGMSAIRARAGRTVPVVVARPDPTSGRLELVDLGAVPVSRQGTIGFLVGVDPSDAPAVVATWPSFPVSPESTPPSRMPAAPLHLVPGSRITHVNDEPISTFADLRAALRHATQDVAGTTSSASVTLTLRLPLPAASEEGSNAPIEHVTWRLDPEAVSTLHNLGWTTDATALFPRAETLLKASNPVAAIGKGLKETRRVMLTTYLTLARLFQGTVKVEHLRGPVGIAHAGTILADRGFIWLLFFLALVSVNLAVVNFLPLPIADGGHMVYLTYEAITGRPVSVAVQNAAALAGIVLIVGLFLIVTFNDVSRLFGF